MDRIRMGYRTRIVHIKCPDDQTYSVERCNKCEYRDGCYDYIKRNEGK